MIYGFNREHATILKRVARREGLKSRTGAKISYPKPMPDDVYFAIGKPDANIAKGASGTVSIWEDDSSADSGDNVTAKALGAAVTSAKWVTVWKLGTTYYVAPWEC